MANGDSVVRLTQISCCWETAVQVDLCSHGGKQSAAVRSQKNRHPRPQISCARALMWSDRGARPATMRATSGQEKTAELVKLIGISAKGPA